MEKKKLTKRENELKLAFKGALVAIGLSEIENKMVRTSQLCRLVKEILYPDIELHQSAYILTQAIKEINEINGVNIDVEREAKNEYKTNRKKIPTR